MEARTNTRTNLLHAFEATILAQPLYARFRALPVCQSLAERECMLLFSCFDMRGYNAGEVIYEAGTRSENTMYLVVEGRAAVSGPGGDVYARRGPGEVFGLFSFLDEERPHSATVTAETDMAVLSISRSYFNVITVEDPTLGNQLLRLMFRLLSRLALRLESEYAALHEFALASR